MNTRNYIDTLFSDYQETPALEDFKEELCGYMNEQIADLIKRGMDEKSAFEKAAKDLGDMSVVADEVSRRKKQEILSEMYMGTRKYLTPGRTGLFIFGGAVVCFGLFIAAITWFVTEMQIASLGSGMLFVVLGTGFLTFMGLTQETAAKNPMSWKRAVFYAVSVVVFLVGITSMPLVYFATTGVSPAELAEQGWNFSAENLGFTSAIAVMVPLVLPSIALFIFLVLTEKDRSKPWVAKLRQEAAQREAQMFGSPAQQARFGLICGALWIAAITGFILLTIFIGIKLSWLAIVVALVIQMIIMAVFAKSE